jgi:hypothetical protein
LEDKIAEEMIQVYIQQEVYIVWQRTYRVYFLSLHSFLFSPIYMYVCLCSCVYGCINLTKGRVDERQDGYIFSMIWNENICEEKSWTFSLWQGILKNQWKICTCAMF